MTTPTDAREQARHNASVMIAFAEGKEIQVKFGFGPWMKVEYPSWDWRACQFRVKPEERKPREWRVWVNPMGEIQPDECDHHQGKILAREVLPETETE